MINDSWNSIDCTLCGTCNWVHNYGDESDPEPDACKCWKCGLRFWLMPEEDVKMMGDESIDDVYCEDGEKQAGGTKIAGIRSTAEIADDIRSIADKLDLDPSELLAFLVRLAKTDPDVQKQIKKLK